MAKATSRTRKEYLSGAIYPTPIKACYLHLGLIYKRSATYAIQQQYSPIWAGVVVDTVGGFVHFKGN